MHGYSNSAALIVAAASTRASAPTHTAPKRPPWWRLRIQDLEREVADLLGKVAALESAAGTTDGQPCKGCLERDADLLQRGADVLIHQGLLARATEREFDYRRRWLEAEAQVKKLEALVDDDSIHTGPESQIPDWWPSPKKQGD